MTSSTRCTTRHDLPSPEASQLERMRPPVALLIAGEPAQADHYGQRLRTDGYTVLTAPGLERGLELAGARGPDLIFVCLGSWAVPSLALLVLRMDPATRGLPTVVVADRTRAELAAAVGGLLQTEHVISRRAVIPRPPAARPGCRRPPRRAG
jgi:hypothetical protein